MGDVQVGPVTRLSPADVQALWVNNGGDPSKALLAAAVVFGAENPAGNAGLVNDTPETGDYSVGLWQINYYGGLEAAQTARFGSADALAANPDAQARAVIAMSQNGTNWQPWGPDFGYSGYGQTVSAPLAGSKVANWLSANGGASPEAPSASPTFAVPPMPVLLATLGFVGVGVWGVWAALDLPNPLRKLGFA